ncbi:MAG: hypothetical protein JXR84_14850 [Anaerolineae bacterium]|nr:hypothetical protein [Anaerolineae bacterium]
MDHTKVLKRAWEILKQYRVLWIFGLILALTTASPATQSSYQFDRTDVPPDWQYTIPEGSDFQEAIEAFVRWLARGAWRPAAGVGLAIVGIVMLLVIALIVITTIARYVSETSMMRMVDAYEESGEKLRFRQGWKLGWSREAWRLFLIDLVIFFPVFFSVIVLLGLSGLPLLMWASGDTTIGVIGTVASTGLFFFVIFAIVVAIALLRLLKRFFRRVCVLEKVGVGEALRQGFAMAKQNWKDVGLMWLITVGISIGWTFVTIPIALLLIGVGAVVSGATGLMAHGLVGLVAGDIGAWIVAALVALPIFILVIALPIAFLGALKEVYVSNTWTLTYRELQALDQLRLLAEPVVSEPDILESA